MAVLHASPWYKDEARQQIASQSTDLRKALLANFIFCDGVLHWVGLLEAVAKAMTLWQAGNTMLHHHQCGRFVGLGFATRACSSL